MNEVVIKLQQQCWEQDWVSPFFSRQEQDLPLLLAPVMERMRCLYEFLGYAKGKPPGLLAAVFCVYPPPEVVW